MGVFRGAGGEKPRYNTLLIISWDAQGLQLSKYMNKLIGVEEIKKAQDIPPSTVANPHKQTEFRNASKTAYTQIFSVFMILP